MILIVCLDDQNGMMFNKRRQSQDVEVRKDIAASVGDGVLYMSEYSVKQFSDMPQINISAGENFAESAAEGEFCFWEGERASIPEEKIEKIIVYKWNRLYPQDIRFDIALENWKLESSAEFAGNSHEKITKEVYIK